VSLVEEIEKFGECIHNLVGGIKEVRALVANATTDEDWDAVSQAAEKVVDEVEKEAEADAPEEDFGLLDALPTPCKLCDVPGKPYMSDLVLDWHMCMDDGITEVCKYSMLNELDCFIEAMESLLGYGAWALEEADGNEGTLGMLIFLELDGIHRMAVQGLRFHSAGEALHAAYAKRSMKSPLADMDLRELLIRALKMHNEIKKRNYDRK